MKKNYFKALGGIYIAIALSSFAVVSMALAQAGNGPMGGRPGKGMGPGMMGAGQGMMGAGMGQNFEENKKFMISQMEEKIQSLQKAKACIEAIKADDPNRQEAMKKCHMELREARKEMRDERMDHKIDRLEKRKEMLEKRKAQQGQDSQEK